MTDPSSPAPTSTPAAGGSPAFHLCDLARTSREFALTDLTSGEVFEFSEESDVRRAAETRYSGAQFYLTTRRSVVDGNDMGLLVIIAVLRRDSDQAPWRPVACISGAVHGPGCVPFSPSIWSDAVDGLRPRSTAATPGAPGDKR